MIHLIGAAVPVPYPSWLNPADNTWQMTAATFVGLMSIPGLAVLYASIVPKKWAVNVLAMMFAGFSLVLVAWFFWEYKLGFGSTSLGGGVNVVHGVVTQTQNAGTTGTSSTSSRTSSGNRAHHRTASGTGPGDVGGQHPHPVPLPDGDPGLLPVRLRGHHPAAVPRQRARADQVPRLVPPRPGCGRPSSTASTPSCSGAAATSPRRGRSTSRVGTSSTCRPVSPASWRPGCSDRGSCEIGSTPCPTTWSWRRSVPASCGWAGTGSTAATRTTPVPAPRRPSINTNLATGVGVLVWMLMDAWLTKEKKPTFLGGVNGMICGLVGITPCAGFVNGWGAIAIGAICSAVVWVAWNYLSKVPPFSKVDDALGRRLHPRHRRLPRWPAVGHLR